MQTTTELVTFFWKPLEALITRTVYKVVNSPEYMSRFSNTVIDNTILIALLAVLVESEQLQFATELANIEDACQQFLEVGTKIDPHPVSAPSKGSDLMPTNILDDKTNPRVYSIQHSQIDYGNE